MELSYSKYKVYWVLQMQDIYLIHIKVILILDINFYVMV